MGTRDCCDALILAVPHQLFRDQPADAYLKLLNGHDGLGVVVDVSGVLREGVARPNLLASQSSAF